MKAILAVALLALPAPAGFQRAKALEPAASYVAHKPVVVWCSKTSESWVAYVGRAPGQPQGATVAGSNQTFLDFDFCAPLIGELQGSEFPYASLAPTIETLTHEAIHARGETDEGVTDCAAVHEMPGVAVRFFHVLPGKRLRALMAAAWKWRAHEAPAYRTVC